MTGNNNNAPLIEEQRIIEQTEQEIIAELREKVASLQTENKELEENLEAKRKHADKMDDLAVEYFQALQDDNEETELVAVLEKRKQIKDLKEELTQKDQELQQKNNQISSLEDQIGGLNTKLNSAISGLSKYSVNYNELRQKIDKFKREYGGTDNIYQYIQNWFYSPDHIISANYTFRLPSNWNRETLERLCRDIKASVEAKNLLNSL